MVSVQLAHPERRAGLLIIRRSWVRAPPAPPALGSTQVRKVRGPLLDTLYARLMRCGNLACTGKPFTEHRNIPDLRPDPADHRPEWQQAADKLRAAIQSAELASSAALGLYLWLVVVTGVRRGELCGLQIRDIDLDRGLVHVAFNYVVRGGRRVRKDTKTHQDRWLAIDSDTCALIVNYLDEIRAELAAVGVELRDDAYLFSNDPAHSRPWNPDWATHKVAEAADAAGARRSADRSTAPGGHASLMAGRRSSGQAEPGLFLLLRKYPPDAVGDVIPPDEHPARLRHAASLHKPVTSC